jgi:hypothetical protein
MRTHLSGRVIGRPLNLNDKPSWKLLGGFFHLAKASKCRRAKERKGRPVESAAPEKISQGRLRHICLTIFTAAWKTQQGFPRGRKKFCVNGHSNN